MIDYQSSFVNTDGAAFPDTLGKNATGAGATDGTEFVKLFVDDIWGRFQALMDYAGLTPDGVTEAPGTAQHITAIGRGFGVGPGIGVIYWKDGDPATNGDRVLLQNGQGVLRSSYPLLDTACYVGDGNNAAVAAAGGAFFHADNSDGSSPNTAGIYLILPETRGYVLRGLDLAAAVDEDGASRVVGDAQLDQMQQITGDAAGQRVGRYGSDIGNGALSMTDAGNTLAAALEGLGNPSYTLNFDSANSPNARTGTTTRMVNVSVRYAITY